MQIIDENKFYYVKCGQQLSDYQMDRYVRTIMKYIRPESGEPIRVDNMSQPAYETYLPYLTDYLLEDFDDVFNDRIALTILLSEEFNDAIILFAPHSGKLNIIFDYSIKNIFLNSDNVVELVPQFHIFNVGDWYVSEVDGKIHNAKFIEKQDGEKPTDEIEPKFKPGDWIVFNGLTLHIDEVVNGYPYGYYRTTSRGDGIHNSYDWNIDNAARLWTIADAKDGDVLATNNGNCPFIYKTKTIFGNPVAYCGVRSDGLFISESPENHQWCLKSEVIPATKAQRDLLFSKMKEEGYEWDAKKKEVKTIEQKPVDKVESKFKVGNWYQCIKDFFGKGVTFDKGTAYYCAKEGCLLDGCHIAIVEDLYDNFKLWTIEDAKDGDILTANVQRGELGYDEYPFRYIPITFIYRKTNNDNYNIRSYCDMCFDGILKPSYRMFAKDFIRDICPATEEQRELLFQKIKEEDHEWDSEKRELKRIEPKTLDADDILPYLGNNQVQDILEDMGMLDDNGRCPHTAEEIFKAGMEHAFNLNREAASSIKVK